MSARSRSRKDYTVGWVCARPKEQTAAIAMLDERHIDLPIFRLPNDYNTYTLGSIGSHNIAITCLSKGMIGSVSAAVVATQMTNAFPYIEFTLMVGIGSGIPLQVRLGDIVVGTPTDQYPGVIQWDLGKEAAPNMVRRTESWNNPPRLLLSAVSKLISEHDLGRSRMSAFVDEMVSRYPPLASKYLKSESLVDLRFKAEYDHRKRNEEDTSLGCLEAHSAEEDEEDEEEEVEGCRYCDKTQVVNRQPRDMRVHYGLIASGNSVVENANFRDKLRRDLGGNVLCVETGAGLMDSFPCMVIRGICDYADSHKNTAWEEHAAAMAAAYAKELLGYVPPVGNNRERRAKDVLNGVSSAASSSNGNLASQKGCLAEKKDLETLDWLAPTDYAPLQTDFLGEREPGTGQWLLNSNEYQDWRQGLHNTLFCRGDPGTGKTVLAAMIVDDLESEPGQDIATAVSYVYCNYKRQGEQTAEHLLSSLLKQLAQSRSSLPESVKQLYHKHKERRTRPSLDEISEVLESVTSKSSPAYIIVDALDECQISNNCRAKFLSAIFKLQAKPGVNVLVTSRPIPEIVEEFEGKTTIEVRAPDDDIRKYLCGHIPELRDFVASRPDLQDTIMTSIARAVDGTFLLAQLYFTSLIHKETPKALLGALRDIDARSKSHDTVEKQTMQYDMAYNHAMAQIEGQLQNLAALAKQVLSWITCAKRPLTKLEVQHAIAVEINELHLDSDNIRQVADLVSVCAGLVTVDKESSIVRLVHHTAQEYFVRNHDQWFPSAHLSMAITCTTYLSYKDFENGCTKSDVEFKERLQLHPLYDYAARNWAYHSRDNPTHQNILSFLGKLAQVAAASQAVRNAGYLGYPYVPKRPTGLHLAACFGRKEVIRSIVGEYVADQVDSYGRTVLWWAAGDGQKAIVELLLAPEGTNPNSKATKHGWTPLWLAVDTENEILVELLLTAERVHHVGGDDDDQWRPLWLTAHEKDAALLKLLLTTEGVNPNLKNEFGWTLIHNAVQNKNETLVKLLLATEGVDPNAKNNLSWTPLHEGVQIRNDAVVKLLLAAKRIDPNLQNHNGCTPLMLAADLGNMVAARMLLDAGADVDIVDKAGRTALGHAVLFQQLKLELMLLEYMAFRPRDFFSLQRLFSEEPE